MIANEVPSPTIVETSFFLSKIVGDTLLQGGGDVIESAGSQLKRAMGKWYCDVEFGQMQRFVHVPIPDDVKTSIHTIYQMGWHNVLQQRNPDAAQAFDWIAMLLGTHPDLRYQAQKEIKEEYGVL